MKQTFTILIWASRGKHKGNEASLYARLTVNGKRAEISLGRKINIQDWDETNGVVKRHSPGAEKANEHIEIIKGELRQHYYQLRATGQVITAEAIKNKFMGIGEEQRTLLDVVRYHNKEMIGLLNKGIAETTYKQYAVVQKKIERFLLDKYKKSDIPLADLKYKFITDFAYFLKTTDSLEHNSCIKYIKTLKKIINYCIKNEWIERNPFHAFKCTTEEVDREVLTEEEMYTLRTKELPLIRLQEARDIFIFSCYTGYAYADVRSLTPNHVGIGLDGEKWIFTHRRKTDNRSNVMLLPIALDLINKYKKHPGCLANGTLFPVKSNQKYNNYLKEVAVICNINKRLTTHIARHTFATTITLSNNVPIETVSSMLGHKSIRTTQIYAKIVQEKVSNDMKNLRDRLTGHVAKSRQG